MPALAFDDDEVVEGLKTALDHVYTVLAIVPAADMTFDSEDGAVYGHCCAVAWRCVACLTFRVAVWTRPSHPDFHQPSWRDVLGVRACTKDIFEPR